jgi:predicted transcriptional regulator
MMETKRILVEIKPFRESMDELGKTLDKISKGEIISDEKVIFDNVDVFRKVLTPQRIKLLRLIRHYKPKSVYQLAKYANRNRRAVITDLKILMDLGFVSKKKSHEGKRTLTIPQVSFSRMDVAIPI